MCHDYDFKREPVFLIKTVAKEYLNFTFSA